MSPAVVIRQHKHHFSLTVLFTGQEKSIYLQYERTDHRYGI